LKSEGVVQMLAVLSGASSPCSLEIDPPLSWERGGR